MNLKLLFKLISMVILVLSVPVSSVVAQGSLFIYPKCLPYGESLSESINIGQSFIGIDWRTVTPTQLKKVLSEVDVNVTDANGATPLHYAARWYDKDTEIFSMLLERGADINSQDNEGNTPTHDAIHCSEDNTIIINYLLRNGADVSIKNESGIAVANSMNRFGMSLLRSVVREDNVDINLLSFLLQNGANADFMGDEDSVGTTPLHSAIIHGASSDIIALLLQHGADPNVLFPMDDSTPLHSAVSRDAYSQFSRQNKINTIRLLLEYGADPNARPRGTQSHPPIFNWISGFTEPETYSLLIEYGADVNIRGYLGMTPLHFLLRFRHHDDTHIEGFQSFGDYSEIDDIESYYLQLINESALILLEGGAEVNAKTDEGDTPLHYAVQQSLKLNPEIISILLKNGADVNIKNNAGMTALEIGESNKHFVNSEAYQLLKEHTTVE